MRIAIDAHSVGTQLGGNETYATNLIEALAEIDSQNQYTVFVTKRTAMDRFANRWPNVSARITAPHTPLIRIPLTLSGELRRHPVDVLHVQYTAPPFSPCPVVVNIHDLSFEHLPETFKRRSRMQLRMTVRRSARQAAEILALSDYARHDIITTYKISPDKVTVVPLAAAAHFIPVEDTKKLQQVRQTYGIQGDYILSVGSIQPRKNLTRLLQAYALLRAAEPAGKLPQLVIVGKHAWLYAETVRAVNELGLANHVVLTGYIPDEDLPPLYSGAVGFVYPSYFEGFGLPPLEAMKCGTPVIVGNRTSLPEVVGDAAILVDPFSTEEIERAMSRLINDASLRSSLRAKGLERAKLFDWRETARQTLSVYEKVAARRS